MASHNLLEGSGCLSSPCACWNVCENRQPRPSALVIDASVAFVFVCSFILASIVIRLCETGVRHVVGTPLDAYNA
eukprot:5947109-Prymnesium_polylepis.2